VLSVITEAVKGSLSPSRLKGSEASSQHESKTEKEMSGSDKKEDVVMLDHDSEMKSLERDSKEQELNSIWRVNMEKATPSSSLFGSSISSKPSLIAGVSGRSSFATFSSSLFGGKSDIVVQRSNLPLASAGHSNFAEVVVRINRSLTMAPVVPQVVEHPIDQTENMPPKDVVEASDAQVEIPFVPASQRPAKREEKDTIVVVGQMHQKRKRKADKSSAQQVEEPFDFSSVPNILDDNPEPVKEEEETETKRKRQRKMNKKGGTFYGDFPAPPKAQSELKSGNKSYTFK